MPVLTIGQILTTVDTYEKRLEAFYADLRDRTTSDGVRLVTHYLARRKRHIPDALAGIDDHELERVNRILVSIDIEELERDSTFTDRILDSQADANKLLATAIEFVEILIGFYQTLAAQAIGENARQLVNCFLTTETNDLVELKKICAMNYF